jgi:hypothetical protein
MQLKHLDWPGFNANGTVIIELEPEVFGLTESAVDIDGETFEAKAEHHVTVIGTELGLTLQQAIASDHEVDSLLAKSFATIDWSFEQTGPVHLLSRVKDSRLEKSVILLISMPGLADFYRHMITLGLIPAETQIPPAHITLYTKNCPNGIGVPSVQRLKLLSVRTMSLKELNKLCP